MENKKLNQRQKRIRNLEWNAIVNILQNYQGNFIDIGAGTGYSMYKAADMGFQVYGIEPCLNEHGVIDPNIKDIANKIQEGSAEYLPFPDHFFQIVYASHSLEHFENTHKGLSEMERVLDQAGIAIIIVPTGIMAFVNLISHYLFTTHRRIGKFLIRKKSLKNFRNIFFPDAHGSQCSTIIGEISLFRVKRWKKLIKQHFDINQILLPCLYPYPDFPQLFPYISNNKVSSSVVFICSRKDN
ncbi:MAG: putative methyltransferase YcgJ [Candidatus Ordinivivax streblomastigis]|uniref:Putative methyltransferase YcgJ n=1 Tax=Candidatus Ordinivivax streblomastigis TaxID=2540710 RepID=A0A5M8P1M5_9BACT|nr:MAG: putative methyltransferase YcgJ [Candidatus Ordinivivax streblomastigis]